MCRADFVKQIQTEYFNGILCGKLAEMLYLFNKIKGLRVFKYPIS